MKHRLLSLLLACCLLLPLSACSENSAASSSGDAPQQTASAQSETASSDAPQSAAASADSAASGVSQAADGSSQEAETQTATLYIGMGGEFREYPVEYTGELTPLFLVSQISRLTGWNLDLADEITSGKGGMTVSFAETSALVVGPPDPQTPDFFVYDARQLVLTILDSIQHTLQYNFVDPELGDPSSLDIYFTLDGEAIVVPESGETIDPYAPYQSLS